MRARFTAMGLKFDNYLILDSTCRRNQL